MLTKIVSLLNICFTMIRLKLTIMLLLIFSAVFSQETCKVLLPNIAGQYEGMCKNGRADGKGKAEGIDQYEGNFKDGLPNGNKIYRWKNGEIHNRLKSKVFVDIINFFAKIN